MALALEDLREREGWTVNMLLWNERGTSWTRCTTEFDMAENRIYAYCRWTQVEDCERDTSKTIAVGMHRLIMGGHTWDERREGQPVCLSSIQLLVKNKKRIGSDRVHDPCSSMLVSGVGSFLDTSWWQQAFLGLTRDLEIWNDELLMGIGGNDGVQRSTYRYFDVFHESYGIAVV